MVTDAYGHSLADRPLLGSGAEYQMSVVASANPVLHEQVLAEIDARWSVSRLGFAQLRNRRRR